MVIPTTSDAFYTPVPSTAEMQSLQQMLGGAPPHRPTIALLQLGAQSSSLRIYTSAHDLQEPVVHPLPLGLETLAVQTFRGHWPTEAQLEHGIMLVEDAIMPLAPHLPADSILVTRDPYLLDVGQHALGSAGWHPSWGGTPGLTTLRRESVETLFHQLAQQSTHATLLHRELPPSAHWAAALLFLREVLHHWQKTTLRLWHSTKTYAEVEAPRG